jgi:hypothetical protein
LASCGWVWFKAIAASLFYTPYTSFPMFSMATGVSGCRPSCNGDLCKSSHPCKSCFDCKTNTKLLEHNATCEEFWGWTNKLHILDLQIQNHSKFVLHLLFQIDLGRWIETNMCISTWTTSKTKMWLWFLWEWGISSSQGVPKIVVLTNYEDENDLRFFQKLKWVTALAPPSYVVPFGPQFIPSSSNLSFRLWKYNKEK